MMRAEQELLRQLTCSRSRWNTVKLSAFTFHICFASLDAPLWLKPRVQIHLDPASGL